MLFLGSRFTWDFPKLSNWWKLMSLWYSKIRALLRRTLYCSPTWITAELSGPLGQSVVVRNQVITPPFRKIKISSDRKFQFMCPISNTIGCKYSSLGGRFQVLLSHLQISGSVCRGLNGLIVGAPKFGSQSSTLATNADSEWHFATSSKKQYSNVAYSQ